MNPRARVQLAPAFVLHHRSYRESSLLLEIFSREFGRLGLVARGARRPKSPLRGVLQPFRPLVLSWSGRGELGALTGAEPLRPCTPPSGEGLIGGFYVNELLMRLLHRHDPHPDLFTAYEQVVSGLGTSGPYEGALRTFEKRLLDDIGYGLILEHDAMTGEVIDASADYHYVPELGPVRTPAPSQNGLRVAGRSLNAIRQGELDEDSLRDAKRLMRFVLRGHLGDRPLESRRLFGASR